MLPTVRSEACNEEIAKVQKLYKASRQAAAEIESRLGRLQRATSQAEVEGILIPEIFELWQKADHTHGAAHAACYALAENCFS